jgi:hypothetical protein
MRKLLVMLLKQMESPNRLVDFTHNQYCLSRDSVASCKDEQIPRDRHRSGQQLQIRLQQDHVPRLLLLD